MANKRRILILGGGVGAMTTAFELTNWDGWQETCEVDVYQVGWRLGGKGASGRRQGLGDRIEEHGLHVWMGFYENAFHVIRQAYEECARRNLTPRSPFRTWEDAFTRQDYATNMERAPGGWTAWPIHFPPNDTLPGDPEIFDRRQPAPSPWDLFVMALEWLWRRLDELEQLAGAHPAPLHLADLLARIAIRAEQRSSAVLRDVLDHLAASAVRPGEEVLTALLGVLEHVADAVLAPLGGRLEREPDLRHAYYLVDSGAAMARGLVVDDVIGQGFAVIDAFELTSWLARHGCRHPANPFVVAGYDALFAYEKGDPSRPRISAGVSIHGVMRMMFTYRGSMFWRMNAGMGDTIFSPLYLLLKARGVRFHFFHRAMSLGLDASRTAIDTVVFDIQATLKDQAAGYQPLYEVGGIPCWPSEPFYEQLVEGDALRGHSLESDYTEWRGRIGTRTLSRGADFDDVVLGIPPAAARSLTGELAHARPQWAAMLDMVASVQTQAMQLWLKRTSEDLGFPQPGHGQRPAITAFVEPFDTWADMSHLLDRETWTPADGVRSIAYFCNAFEDAPAIPPPFTDPSFPASQLARVRQMALQFLTGGDVQVLWPACGQPFDWRLLAHRSNATDDALLDTQFLRANIDATERYVLSLPGTTGARLAPDGSGFANLYLAGDWTGNVINAGCVEAGVISGRLASHAICGQPEHIYGAFGSTASS